MPREDLPVALVVGLFVAFVVFAVLSFNILLLVKLQKTERTFNRVREALDPPPQPSNRGGCFVIIIFACVGLTLANEHLVVVREVVVQAIFPAPQPTAPAVILITLPAQSPTLLCPAEAPSRPQPTIIPQEARPYPPLPVQEPQSIAQPP